VARSRGADELIDYKEESIRDRVRALTAGKGADVVYDPVGGDAFDQALRAVNWEARMLVIGFAAGRIQAVPANLILVKNISRKRRMAREQDMKQTRKKHGAQPQAAGPQFRERPSKARFAPDSPLEGNGFEPSVPRERDYAFQDRPVRSLRQFRSRDGDNFRQAGGGTDLGRPASRQINRRRCVKRLTHVPGLASLAISGSAPGCAWGPACYGGRHAEDQSMEPQHAEGRARPALARGAPSA
jgi:Zinc-binding dehydrogenase